MAIGDVYRAIMKQHQGARNISNVFWFLLTDGNLAPGYSLGLGGACDSSIGDAVRLLQSNSIVTDGWEVVCMVDPTDYAFYPVSDSGDIEDEADLTTRAAFQYRFNRAGPGTRAGFKRFAGLTEERVAGNNWAPDLTNAHALEVQMALVQETDDGVFQPVIVGGTKELGVAPTVRYAVTTVTAMQQITTQRNRLRSSGAALPGA